MRKLTFFALFALLSFSCAKENQDTKDDLSNQISFNSGIMSTRAAIESGAGDLPTSAVPISILRGGDGAGNFTIQAGAAGEAKGSVGTNGTITGVTPVQNFAPGLDAKFMAVHPQIDAVNFVTRSGNVVTFPIPNNGQFDVLAAPGVTALFANKLTPVSFKLGHQLTRIKLVIVADASAASNAYGNLKAASLVGVPDALLVTFDAAKGEVSSASTTNLKPITFAVAAAGIALPAPPAAAAPVGDIMVPVPAGGKYTTINLTFEKRLAADYAIAGGVTVEVGKITTITATVSQSGITFNSTVAKWGDGKDGSVSVN